MTSFRKLGFRDDNGGIYMHSSFLDVVLYDHDSLLLRFVA
jgi:hypothetical protein